MLNSIGLANPGIDAFSPTCLPRLARARRADLGLGRRLLRRTSTPSSARASTTGRVDGARAERLLPERRRSRRRGRGDRRRGARRDGEDRSTRSSRLPFPTSRAAAAGGSARRGGRPLAREHDSRARARRADARAEARSTALGGLSGPALRPIALAAVFAAYRATGLPIVGMGGVETGRHALELIAAGASSRSRSERCSSPTRKRRPGCAPSWRPRRSPAASEPRLAPTLQRTADRRRRLSGASPDRQRFVASAGKIREIARKIHT